MNAIVLAGGRGLRLNPLTLDTPKPMLPVCNRPTLDYCVSQLYNYGVRDIVFALGYKPEKIIEYASGYRDVKTRFCVETEPLGTLGCVKSAARYLDDVFLVASGDGVNDIDLSALLMRHRGSGAAVTIAVKKVDNPTLYGVAECDGAGFVRAFVEKPHTINYPAYINCGVYAVNKSVLGEIPDKNCDFARDLFPRLVAKGELAYYVHDGYWEDIGDFAAYYRTNFDMKEGGFFPRADNASDAEYSSSAVASADSLVSDSATTVGQYRNCIIGRRSRVASGSVLTDCLVLDDVIVRGMYSDCIISDCHCIDVKAENITAQIAETPRAFLN